VSGGLDVGLVDESYNKATSKPDDINMHAIESNNQPKHVYIVPFFTEEPEAHIK